MSFEMLKREISSKIIHKSFRNFFFTSDELNLIEHASHSKGLIPS